jgi:hypothetical protein
MNITTKRKLGQAGLFAVAALTLAANAADTTKELPASGFTCCNLHYGDDWIGDGNDAALPMIGAGTPVHVLSGAKHKAKVEIAGRKMRMGQDYGLESLPAWMKKMVVAEDPRVRIATFPADVQAAIKLGQLMAGMTREQALISVGYPQNEGFDAYDASAWKLRFSEYEEYTANWGDDGRLRDISGDARVRAMVTYRP